MEIPGLVSFTGTVIHSHDYRRPELFQDMDVVVFGGGMSGSDISLDLSDKAKRIYFSHRNPLFKHTEFPSNIEQVPPIFKITDDGLVQFTDGRTQRADAILLCTGYRYSFPFLSPECHVTVDLEGKRVNSLYMGVFHPEHPSLSFVGVQTYVLPFPIFAIQAQCIMAVLSGKAKLPSREEMEKVIIHEREKLEFAGLPAKEEHKLGPKRRSYAAALAKLAGCPSVDPVLDDIFDYLKSSAIYKNRMHFKKQQIIIKGSTYIVKK